MCNLMNILKIRKNCFGEEGECLKMDATFEVSDI